MNAHSQEAKNQLIETIEQRLGPIESLYRNALLTVDRELFVRTQDHALAYVDEPLPLDTPYGEHVATISAPHAYVLGFRALQLSPGDAFLEFGSGTGYGAALASHIVGPTGHVTSVEVDPFLTRLAQKLLAPFANVQVLCDDGTHRVDLVTTHTKIWFTFAIPAVPLPMLESLSVGSKLVAPIGHSTESQKLICYTRKEADLEITDFGNVRFVPMRGLIGMA